MKILHVITSLENAGAEALLNTLVRADTSNEHSIICLYRDGHYGPLFRESGYVVESLDMPRGKLTFQGLKKLYLLLKSSEADVIQAWMFHSNLLAGFVGRLAGKKSIFWGLHNTGMSGAGVSRSTNAVNYVCAWTSGIIPRHVVHSSRTGAAEHVELGYSRKKMTVIPGGYNLDRFSANQGVGKTKREELGVSDNDVLIGMFARWHPQKDHGNLIRSISMLEPSQKARVKIALFGDGIASENYELVDQLEADGVSNYFLLVGPVADAPAYMSAIDMHVLSSAYGESFPNVVNESMACSVPCIVTDVADSGLIVGDVGLIVPPQDPKALMVAISTYLAEIGTEKWELRKRQSRQRIEDNFSVEALVEQYNSMWQEYRAT